MLRSTRPWFLLAGILMYAFGVGIADYLGYSISWTDYWLGQALVTLLQLSSGFLKEYYDTLEEAGRTVKPTGQDRRQVDLYAKLLLQAALTALAIGAVVTVLMISRRSLNVSGLILLGVGFAIAFFYAVPPLRLVYSGYGELGEALLVANIVPALAFLFQAKELHRFLGLLTFPVTAIYLAMKLALSLPFYSSQVLRERRTMLVRLGWQRAMVLHNLLILAAYLLVGSAALLGLPWLLTWPVLLTLPLGLLQIWRIIQIGNGAPPRWRSFTLLAAAVFGITAYLIVLSLWIN
jgi:1,4-dihydroxy-2-naphthoate octaprenyltransferase